MGNDAKTLADELAETKNDPIFRAAVNNRYAVTEKGVVKPKASPELLPLELRNLPGDLVTKDIEDEHKAHKEDIDTPHVIHAIAKERAKAELGIGPFDPTKEPPPPEAPGDDVRLTQEWVDIRRLRVMREWANTQKARLRGGADKQPANLQVVYLWFPEDDHRGYELRYGNPPADSDRPLHLRRLRLEIDLLAGDLPATIITRLREKGVEVTNVWADMVREATNPNLVLTSGGEPWR